MGDLAATPAFPDSLWAHARSPLPFSIRRIARRRAFAILAALLVTGIFLLNRSVDVSDVSVSRVQFIAGEAAPWPSTAPMGLADMQPGDATSPASQGHLDDDDDVKDHCTTWRYATEPKGGRGLYLDSFAPAGGWQKPRALRVVAMVFYGRRRNVDILDCYLQQNLARNGGYLDDVLFMVHARDAADIAWLADFVKRDPLYKFVRLGSCGKEDTYGCIWENAVEEDTLYIKIDDDILYIHHDAIPQLVHTRLAQPHPYAISAQLVNSPVTCLQQYHYGAIHAFLPDPSPYPTRNASSLWRPTHFSPYPSDAPTPADPLSIKPSYRGHPWLLVSDNGRDKAALKHTPIGQWSANPGSDPVAFGPAWKSWAIAAQQQYSLLYNLERNQMDVYHFGRPLRFTAPDASDDGSHSYYSADGHYHRHPHEHYSSSCAATVNDEEKEYSGPGGEQLYDTQYERYNLNFVAIWGRDVSLALPILADDEEALTVTVPQRLGRPFVIDTRAVVAHLSFYPQRAGVAKTDLMDRWRAFANENVCRPGNRKAPWGARCEGF